MTDWTQKTITINGKDISVWPQDLEVAYLSQDPVMMIAWFEDFAEYHDALIKRVLELEQDPSFTHQMKIGGSKVRDVAAWGIPEAELLDQRARAFFAQASNMAEAKVEQSWASVYRNGDYLSPHSHNHTMGAVVYCLEWGDPDPQQTLSGRLVFSDPRIAECCHLEPGAVTQELTPDLRNGAMVLFPGAMVHFVHPYSGTRPRITIAWNINPYEN
jgi:hypothetical protein